MKGLGAIFGLMTISLTAMATEMRATADDLNAMSALLPAGNYSGKTPNGQDCKVEVSDSGGYMVRIHPVASRSGNLLVGTFIVTRGARLIPSFPAGNYVTVGLNYETRLSVFKNKDGKREILVDMQMANDEVAGICVLD